jgi:site-specific recombinase XerC
LLNKKAAGRTGATLHAYRSWIKQFRLQVGDNTEALTVPVVTAFSAQLRERGLSASTLHQAYRSLKTFVRWLQRIAAIVHNPLAGLSMRTPGTLPLVPMDEELCAVFEVCPPTLEEIRNRALILAMADAGLRASEVLGLLVEHWNPAERSLFIRGGKGRKDRVWFVGATTARAIKTYLGMQRFGGPEDWLFADASGRPLTPRHVVQVLHRLSARAARPSNRRLHPHALRHYAGTSWLRNGIGGVRNRAIVLVMANAGLRAGQVARGVATTL